MSNETIAQGADEAPLWKRSANVLAVFVALLTLATPVAGWIWSASSRLDRVEVEVKQANLSDKSDRLIRIERDVEWIRRALEQRERKQQKGD